jgi:hypothetical protein
VHPGPGAPTRRSIACLRHDQTNDKCIEIGDGDPEEGRSGIINEGLKLKPKLQEREFRASGTAEVSGKVAGGGTKGFAPSPIRLNTRL